MGSGNNEAPPSDSANRLITIAASHYCEKARWALDYCGIEYLEEAHLPIFHVVPVRRVGGKHPVPVLKTATGLIQGSSTIAEWADSFAPGRLIPAEPEVRRFALALQSSFDNKLGVASRLWAYYHSLRNRRALVAMMSRTVPAWERTVFNAGYPAITFMMQRGMNITERASAYAAEDIDQTFRRVERRLADGRRFLAGDTFSIADIAFAALAAPVLLPDQHPAMVGAMDAFKDQARMQLEKWRNTRAGYFVRGLYHENRHLAQTVATPAIK